MYVSIHSSPDIVDIFREIEPKGMCSLNWKEALSLCLKVIEEAKQALGDGGSRAERTAEIERRMQIEKQRLLKCSQMKNC